MTCPGATERARHWNTAYQQLDETRLSWFEAEPRCSLEMLDAVGIHVDLPAIDVGAGTARLVDSLLGRGFADVTALDISDVGLAHARRRLGPDAARVRWVVADLLTWVPERRYGLWHDRAAFHFLTRRAGQARYRDLLAHALLPGAAVVVATFADDGPTHCSGLPVARYSHAALARALGPGFDAVALAREEHCAPDGTIRPLTWVALRRQG